MHIYYLPCSLNSPPFEHCNNNWHELRKIKLLIIQFSSSSCYFLPLRSTYSPQYPKYTDVGDHVSKPYKPNKTAAWPASQRFPNWMVARNSQIQHALDFFMNIISIYLKFNKSLNKLLAVLMFWYCPTFWQGNMNIHLMMMWEHCTLDSLIFWCGKLCYSNIIIITSFFQLSFPIGNLKIPSACEFHTDIS